MSFKKFVLTGMWVVGSMLVSLASVEASAQSFECDYWSGVANNGYGYSINATDLDVQIKQSSINARYAPLQLKTEEKTYSGPSAEKLRFSCESKPLGSSEYHFKIEIYETEMFIFQSSINARYQVLAFVLH